MKHFELSRRLKRLPPYLFATIDKQKKALKAAGKSYTDVSIGDPDILAPKRASVDLYKYSLIKKYQKYPLDAGLPSFKLAISQWFKKRFKVSLDSQTEILPTLGSKEALIHFPLAFVNPRETIIIPSPGYPGYQSACAFSQARIYPMPLLEKNNFLPDLDKIPVEVRKRAKVMYINYPNNPTGAIAPRSFLKRLVKFCKKHEIILVFDNAYSEVYFNKKPMSILEIKGAKDIAIEFHSLSKTFCMTGFRIGWACGNASLVKGLTKTKTNIDSGLFLAMQKTCEDLLLKEGKWVAKMRKTIKERRDIFIKVLKAAGLNDIYAEATFYIWAKIPKGFKSSLDYAQHLLLNKNIVATPGVGFGKYGEGYIRFALTLDKKILKNIEL